MVSALGKMTDVVDIPVLPDAEGCYANVINTMHIIHKFEQAEISRLFIEDQKIPTNCPFIKKPKSISLEEMIGKIKVALDTRHDKDFIIVATPTPLLKNLLNVAMLI